MERHEEYTKELEQKLEAALHDLLTVSASIMESCLFCKHYQECQSTKCDCYDGMCTESHWGECKKLMNTPCNGCDFKKHWEWRGITE